MAQVVAGGLHHLRHQHRDRDHTEREKDYTTTYGLGEEGDKPGRVQEGDQEALSEAPLAEDLSGSALEAADTWRTGGGGRGDGDGDGDGDGEEGVRDLTPWEAERELLHREIDKDDLVCSCCRPWDMRPVPPKSDWRWRCSKRRPYHIAMDEEGAFPRAQSVNRRCNIVQHHELFGIASLAAILGVTVLIGIQSYDYTADWMSFCESLILCIFVGEIVVKMWARGPLFYFCTYWNIFDFVIVVLTSEVLPIGGDSMAVLRLLRLLRMMKLAKVGPLQAILTGLQKGFRSLVYVMLLLFIVYYVYAIVGIIAFAINDPMHFESLHESMLTLFRVSTLEDWTDIMYLNMYGCGNTAYEYPVQRERPLNLTMAKAGYGYHGTYPCIEPQQWPLFSPVYFCSFVVISALVMLSLFIGLISSEIESERERQEQMERDRRAENRVADTDPLIGIELGRLFAHLGAIKMFFDENALLESRRRMHEAAPESNFLRGCKKVQKFCASGPWQTLILLTIFGAAICAGLETEYSEDGLNPNKDIQDATKVTEVVILCIFTVEAMLLIYAEGTQPWNYFRDKMNCFDFFIVVVCFVVVIASSAFNAEVQALRMMRLLRLLKLVNAFPELKNIINGLIGGLTSIGFITAILLLVFYVYAIIGLLLFRNNDPYHFKNLHTAMLTLFRVSTFEDWTDVMYINYLGCDRWGYSEGANENGIGGTLPDHDKAGISVSCEHPESSLFGSVTYFITFVIIAAFIMLSLFIGVITSSMMEAKQKAQIKALTNALLRQLEKKFPPWLSEKVVDKGHDKITSTRKELFRRCFQKIDTDGGGFLVIDEINSYLYQMYSHAQKMQEHQDSGARPLQRWTRQQRENLLQSIVVNRDHQEIRECLNFAQFLRLMKASELGMSPARLQHDMAITKGRLRLRMEWTPRRPPQAKLVATVLEARGLKDGDCALLCLASHNDVYAKLSISKSGGGTVSQKTGTVYGGGAAPEWASHTLNISHRLSFETDRLPEKLFLRLFDEDSASADDLLGLAEIPLEKPADFGVGLSEIEPWETEQWYTLKNEAGTVTGECLMNLQFIPPSGDEGEGTVRETSSHTTSLPRPNGRFRCTVIEGSGLENMDGLGLDALAAFVPLGDILAGSNDVYTVVTLGMDSKTCPTLLSETERIQTGDSDEISEQDFGELYAHKSETVEDGGSNPSWGPDRSGETLSWDLNNVPSWVCVRVMDEDQLDDDDLIGLAIFDLAKFHVVDGCWEHEQDISKHFKNREGADGAWTWEGWVDIKRERPDDRVESGCFVAVEADKFSKEELDRGNNHDQRLLRDQKVLAGLMQEGPQFLVDLQDQ